jgi:hypothetical protein
MERRSHWDSVGAINACPAAGMVYFPAATYYVGSTLNEKLQCTLMGQIGAMLKGFQGTGMGSWRLLYYDRVVLELSIHDNFPLKLIADCGELIERKRTPGPDASATAPEAEGPRSEIEVYNVGGNGSKRIL